MGHFLSMLGIFVLVLVFFVSSLALYQKFLFWKDGGKAENTETDDKKTDR